MNAQDIYEKIQALVQKEIQDAQAKNEQEQRFQVADIPAHEHTGVDASQISFSNIEDRKLYICTNLFGANAATAANYGIVFIAPFSGFLSGVQAVFSTTSTSGTLQIEKLSGTTALDSGVTMLNSAISLSGTANTVLTGTLSTVATATQFAIGDRIALKDAGTLTNLVGLCVIIELTY